MLQVNYFWMRSASRLAENGTHAAPMPREDALALCGNWQHVASTNLLTKRGAAAVNNALAYQMGGPNYGTLTTFSSMKDMQLDANDQRIDKACRKAWGSKDKSIVLF